MAYSIQTSIKQSLTADNTGTPYLNQSIDDPKDLSLHGFNKVA
jgi:hypothetical protein